MQSNPQLPTTPPLKGSDAVDAINDALKTIGTNFSGDVDPAALTWPYATWADTANNLLKRRNAANTAWVVESVLFRQSLPEYLVGDIPTEDVGDIWVKGVGGYKWSGSAYVKTNFDLANIVGTVSQSSGIPTGAVIESGSNANGVYIKWADGTMICTGSAASSLTTSTGVGNIFQSPSVASFTFPAAFSATPTVMSDSVFTGGAARAWCFLDVATSTDCTIIAAGPTASAVAQPRYLAVGRWF